MANTNYPEYAISNYQNWQVRTSVFTDISPRQQSNTIHSILDVLPVGMPPHVVEAAILKVNPMLEFAAYDHHNHGIPCRIVELSDVKKIFSLLK